MKELIYQDRPYEGKTRADIEISRQAIQDLLECWYKLDLVVLKDYFPLMMNPQ